MPRREGAASAPPPLRALLPPLKAGLWEKLPVPPWLRPLCSLSWRLLEPKPLPPPPARSEGAPVLPPPGKERVSLGSARKPSKRDRSCLSAWKERGAP